MLKRYSTIIVLVLVISVMTASGVLAMGKLINIPTADLSGNNGMIYGELNLDNSFRQLEGVCTINSQLGIGGSMEFVENEEADIKLQAKTVFTSGNSNEPAISAGIKNDSIYFVISKNIGMGFRAHIGVGNGNLGFFAGFNNVVNPVNVTKNGESPSPVINIMGEYANEELSLGTRIHLQENIKFDLALVNLKSLKLGLGYIF